jgi:ABC-type proline/glycine betaine transport system ATPase subunit
MTRVRASTKPMNSFEDGKINIIYGLSGTGKQSTWLSKSLRRPQLHCSGMLGEDQLTAECDPSEGTYH